MSTRYININNESKNSILLSTLSKIIGDKMNLARIKSFHLLYCVLIPAVTDYITQIYGFFELIVSKKKKKFRLEILCSFLGLQYLEMFLFSVPSDVTAIAGIIYPNARCIFLYFTCCLLCGFIPLGLLMASGTPGLIYIIDESFSAKSPHEQIIKPLSL